MKNMGPVYLVDFEAMERLEHRNLKPLYSEHLIEDVGPFSVLARADKYLVTARKDDGNLVSIVKPGDVVEEVFFYGGIMISRHGFFQETGIPASNIERHGALYVTKPREEKYVSEGGLKELILPEGVDGEEQIENIIAGYNRQESDLRRVKHLLRMGRLVPRGGGCGRHM